MTHVAKTVSGLLAAALATIAISACSGSDPILIGLAGPVSEERGVSMRLAAELAVNEINRRGGIGGRDLRLVIGDDSANTQAAIRVAQEFYDQDGVVAVIGHLTSGTTLAAAPVYNGGNDPLLEISPSASSPEVSGAGAWTFRVCPTDLVHGMQLATWARTQLDAQRAAVLYQNDDYGRGVRRTFIASFTEAGGTIVQDDPYILDLPSFAPFLRLLRSQGGADVLVIAGTTTGAERIIPTMDSIGLDIQVVGGDGLSGVQSSGVNADGVLISTAYLADQPGELNGAFVSSYRAAYGNRVPDHRGAGAYDIVHLLAAGLAAVGPDRARLRDYVAGIGTIHPPYRGVTGLIAFDANGDVPNKDVVIGAVTGRLLQTAVER